MASWLRDRGVGVQSMARVKNWVNYKTYWSLLKLVLYLLPQCGLVSFDFRFHYGKYYQFFLIFFLSVLYCQNTEREREILKITIQMIMIMIYIFEIPYALSKAIIKYARQHYDIWLHNLINLLL